MDRRLFPLLLLLSSLLLTQCTLLRHAENINRRHDARQELEQIKKALRSADPGTATPQLLLTYDIDGKYEAELQALLQQASHQPHLAAEIALLQGNGEALLTYAQTPLDQVKAYLLIGNPIEASRLFDTYRLDDLPTATMIYWGLQDTLQTVSGLRQLLSSDRAEVSLPAARLWLSISPDRPEPLHYLQNHSPSEWERFTASARLSNGDIPVSSPDRMAYVAYLQALKTPDSLHLKSAADQLTALPNTPWRTEALLQIRPLLYQQQLWVGALAVHQSLPPAYAADYPYSLLTAYEEEISLLEVYETPEGESLTTPMLSPDEGSFHTIWGHVDNRDNWAMERGAFIHPNGKANIRPTARQYDSIRRHLEQVMPSVAPLNFPQAAKATEHRWLKRENNAIVNETSQ
ncbi:MAG: hypothetical protein Q4E10_02540 [Porphyromonas sp.]|nr:hypothetical protein [Porphyromonas sp.]